VVLPVGGAHSSPKLPADSPRLRAAEALPSVAGGWRHGSVWGQRGRSRASLAFEPQAPGRWKVFLNKIEPDRSNLTKQFTRCSVRVGRAVLLERDRAACGCKLAPLLSAAGDGVNDRITRKRAGVPPALFLWHASLAGPAVGADTLPTVPMPEEPSTRSSL
jgi:hypothetical protein